MLNGVDGCWVDDGTKDQWRKEVHHRVRRAGGPAGTLAVRRRRPHDTGVTQTSISGGSGQQLEGEDS